MSGMKIAITGGHPAPALAVIEEARADKQFKDIKFLFIGRRYNNERESTDSYEYKEATRLGITFENLRTGRLTRIVSPRTAKSMALIPKGMFDAYHILKRHKPDRVLSFGGYIALPVAYAARALGIPVYTHEQTIHPGIASRLIAKVAKRILVSFPESAPFFPTDKTVVTGNPVRRNVFEINIKPFALPKDVPVLYVTGGSLGSHSVNVHIEALLPRLVEQYGVIHQIGNVKEYDDYETMLAARRKLPEALRERYIPVEHLTSEEIGYVYANSSMVIGRSGANTVFELLMLEKPSVLIPLPWSAHDEQRRQARVLEQAGVAEVFEQDGPSEELFSKIRKVMGKLESYRAGVSSLRGMIPPRSAHHVLEIITEE
jgi:UDP-N-acetylglucosamine--N-acetylmuramyl-(pentapeptide) pyrophosphoryl-undecaprenol N-acetylglucosamine transferase